MEGRVQGDEGQGGASRGLKDDLAYQEWLLCQRSLESFDRMILELRRFGFSLVTLLVGASGFLYAVEGMSAITVLGIDFALLVLIVGLFRLDRAHEVFLRAVVLRTMKLEEELGLGLSRTITKWSKPTATWGDKLYSAFCVAATGLAIGAPGTGWGASFVALILLAAACWAIRDHHLATDDSGAIADVYSARSDDAWSPSALPGSAGTQ